MVAPSLAPPDRFYGGGDGQARISGRFAFHAQGDGGRPGRQPTDPVSQTERRPFRQVFPARADNRCRWTTHCRPTGLHGRLGRAPRAAHSGTCRGWDGRPQPPVQLMRRLCERRWRAGRCHSVSKAARGFQRGCLCQHHRPQRQPGHRRGALEGRPRGLPRSRSRPSIGRTGRRSSRTGGPGRQHS